METRDCIYRINLTSWTASFRYPNLISGTQPTLPVPPLSTLNGLISAAMGYPYAVSPNERFGFFFTYESRGVDLETVYQMGQKLTGIKQNVLKREFLVNASLFIYTSSEKIAWAFSTPYFQLTLGRSGDLATVKEIKAMEIPQTKQELLTVKGTVVPFSQPGKDREEHIYLPAPIQALPRAFDSVSPRRNLGTAPFYILDKDYYQKTPIQAEGIHDDDLGIDIFWQ